VIERANNHAWGEEGRGLARKGRGWGGKDLPAVIPKHFIKLYSLTN